MKITKNLKKFVKYGTILTLGSTFFFVSYAATHAQQTKKNLTADPCANTICVAFLDPNDPNPPPTAASTFIGAPLNGSGFLDYTVTNISANPITLNNPQLTGSSLFSIDNTHSSCVASSSVASGASCYYRLVYKNNGAASGDAATLTLQSGTSTQNALTETVHGYVNSTANVYVDPIKKTTTENLNVLVTNPPAANFSLTVVPSEATPTNKFSLSNLSVTGKDSVNYTGGTFPGTGGTCTNPITQTCSIALTLTPQTVAASTLTADLVNFTFTYATSPAPGVTTFSSTPVTVMVNHADNPTVPTITPISYCALIYTDFTTPAAATTCSYSFTNFSTNPITISHINDSVANVSVPISTPLSFSSGTCTDGTVVAPNTSCSFQVSYLPSSTNDVNSQDLTVVYTGAAGSPLSYELDYYTTALSTTAQPMTILPTGSQSFVAAPVTINVTPTNNLNFIYLAATPSLAPTISGDTFTIDKTSTCPSTNLFEAVPTGGCTEVIDFSGTADPTASNSLLTMILPYYTDGPEIGTQISSITPIPFVDVPMPSTLQITPLQSVVTAQSGASTTALFAIYNSSKAAITVLPPYFDGSTNLATAAGDWKYDASTQPQNSCAKQSNLNPSGACLIALQYAPSGSNASTAVLNVPVRGQSTLALQITGTVAQ